MTRGKAQPGKLDGIFRGDGCAGGSAVQAIQLRAARMRRRGWLTAIVAWRGVRAHSTAIGKPRKLGARSRRSRSQRSEEKPSRRSQDH